MKKKIVWLGVTWLIVTALVLSSCGGAVPEEEEEGVEVQILGIGETFQTPEVVVTVSELIITDSYEYYDKASESMAIEKASPGRSFLIITAEIKNVSNVVRQLEGRVRLSVTDSEGNEYLYKHYSGENPLLAGILITGEEIKGKVLFDIPKGASGLKIAYSSRTLPIQGKLAEWVIE